MFTRGYPIDIYYPYVSLHGLVPIYIPMYPYRYPIICLSLPEGNLRKFRSQTSDNMDRWKAEQGRSREKREDQKRKSKKKEDADARKGRKVAKHCVFPMIWGSGGSKSRLAKAAGAEPAGQMRDEKVHAVVARSTFPSQNVQNTPAPDHFWKLRCRKSARRCGAKHISKSKRTKHTMLGPLLEVEMSKKCTPLWREAHFEVKTYKTHHARTTFGSWDVEKVHAVVARSTFRSQNVQNTPCSDHFWKLRRRKSARRCGAKHISKWKCTKHYMFAPLLESLRREAHFEVKMLKTPGFRTTFGGSDVASLHYTTLHYTTLHYTAQHYTTLHYTPLHYTTLHYTPLHFTTLHYTTLHYTTTTTTQLHSSTIHSSTLNYTTLHYTTTTTTNTQLHSTTLNYTTPRYITLHYITLHSTTLHYITLHYITLDDTAPQIDRSTDRQTDRQTDR